MKTKRKKPLTTFKAILTLSFIDSSGKRVRYGQHNFLACNAVDVPFTEKHAIYMAKQAYREIRREYEVLG